MTMRRWWVAVALIGFLALAAMNIRPRASAQAPNPGPGRYQIATFPVPPGGMGGDASGCYLLDTATGQLWTLTASGDGERLWKPLAAPLR